MANKTFEKIKIIVHENDDTPLCFPSSVGIKYTVNGQEEGVFRYGNKPSFTVAEVVELVNHMLYDIIEGGD